MAESIFLQNYGMQFSQRGLEQTKRRIPRQWQNKANASAEFEERFWGT
jgi:hypothetical protein